MIFQTKYVSCFSISTPLFLLKNEILFILSTDAYSPFIFEKQRILLTTTVKSGMISLVSCGWGKKQWPQLCLSMQDALCTEHRGGTNLILPLFKSEQVPSYAHIRRIQ